MAGKLCLACWQFGSGYQMYHSRSHNHPASYLSSALKRSDSHRLASVSARWTALFPRPRVLHDGTGRNFGDLGHAHLARGSCRRKTRARGARAVDEETLVPSSARWDSNVLAYCWLKWQYSWLRSNEGCCNGRLKQGHADISCCRTYFRWLSFLICKQHENTNQFTALFWDRIEESVRSGTNQTASQLTSKPTSQPTN